MAATDAYYNAIDYCFAKDQTRVNIKSHGIRLDQNQKPKNFFLLEVSFNNASKPLGPSSKGARAQQQTITQEKVYGDFKRLHAYIIETFQNELKEFERLERFMSQGRSKGSLHLADHAGVANDELATMLSQGTIGSGRMTIIQGSGPDGENSENGNGAIVLNQRTSEEFYRYGKQYYDEAKRILTHMPRLPSKFSDVGDGHVASNALEGARVTSDQMMDRLRVYINRVIGFSPLIRNLFHLREFLLCSKTGVKGQGNART